MTDLNERLREIGERAEKATHEVWSYEPNQEGSSMGWICSPPWEPLFDVRGDSAQQELNAEFVAAARQDVPALLRAIRELKRQRDDAVLRPYLYRDRPFCEYDNEFEAAVLAAMDAKEK